VFRRGGEPVVNREGAARLMLLAARNRPEVHMVNLVSSRQETDRGRQKPTGSPGGWRCLQTKTEIIPLRMITRAGTGRSGVIPMK